QLRLPTLAHGAALHSVAVRDGAPYKAIVSHGFVLDEQGQKMSKSLGNVLGPNEIIQVLSRLLLRTPSRSLAAPCRGAAAAASSLHTAPM
ncbi:MAG: class I tRNA ligase family protein, partial [Dietzia sp.]